MSEERNCRIPGIDPGAKSPPKSLKILVIGESHALGQADDILDSLRILGYDITLLGVIDRHIFQNDSDRETLVERVTEIVSANRPDLLIMASDSHPLRKALAECLPPQTQILDSFALKIIHELTDVSGQLAATRKKLESVELIKEVLMSGPEVSIMVVDEDLQILEISNAILARTKMSEEDCLNRPCHWVLRKRLESCPSSTGACVVRDVLQTGRSVHTVREERRKDGMEVFFTVSGYPMRRDEYGKRNVLVVWKDVTQAMTPVLDRQAQDIRRSFSQTLRQDKMVALGKLASAAVHEINNPIQGILTFAKLIRQSLHKETYSVKELERYCSYLDLIATESSRCGKILQNLLSFARKGDLRKTRVDVGGLFDEIFLLMGHRMKLQGIGYCREKANNIPLIYGDRDQIKQGLLNVMLNAVEAMPDGGFLSLSAETHDDGRHVAIKIEDTGVGIPKHVQSNIFEPFYTTKGEGKGVGLGLSVVYGIVAQHGGSVEVESEEGQGTRFTLTFPISSEASEADSRSGNRLGIPV